MSGSRNVVLVGGGLAAVRTAQALRERGYGGRMALYADESHWPYDRPPLTKNFLLGKVAEPALRLLDEAAAKGLGLDVHLGRRATGLQPAQRRLLLAGGEEVVYDDLVVATGARPRQLDLLAGCSNAHTLRCLEDSVRLRADLKPGTQVVVLGAGFIGLEVAAVATGHGCAVTVVEPAPVPLAGVLGDALGRVVQAWHERKGVRFLCGAQVERAVTEAGCVLSLALQDGQSLPVDAVLVAVGQQPNVDWLAEAGLHLQQGLVVDDWGRSSDAHVYGVGDATTRLVAGHWRPTRHWTAVTEQAPRVAQALLGQADDTPLVDDHYFWSDQHGQKLQFVGAVPALPQLDWLVGGPEADRFVVRVRDGAAVTAVFGLGSPRDFLMHSDSLRSPA